MALPKVRQIDSDFVLPDLSVVPRPEIKANENKNFSISSLEFNFVLSYYHNLLLKKELNDLTESLEYFIVSRESKLFEEIKYFYEESIKVDHERLYIPDYIIDFYILLDQYNVSTDLTLIREDLLFALQTIVTAKKKTFFEADES